MSSRDADEFAELVGERDQARQRVLSGALWTVAVAFGVTTPWLILWESAPVGTTVVYSIAFIAIWSAALFRTMPFWARFGVLMLCLYFASVTPIAQRGYTPNAFLAMGFMVVLATLVLGRRAGFTTTAITAASTLTISLSQHYGWIKRAADWQAYSDSATFAAMSRVTVIFILVMAAFVVGISYVVERSEELALQKIRSLSALQREQSAKARIWADLEALNRTLEDRVEERTVLLREANESLSREMRARLQVEIELRHAQKLESIGRLAAGIAHEINTPLQYVNDSVCFVRDATADLASMAAHYRRALAALAESRDAPEVFATVAEQEQDLDLDYLLERVPKALERSFLGLERVATIIRSMKEFSHPGQMVMTPIDLNKAILNTLTIATSEYKAFAEVETELAELPLVICHGSELNQAFLNLVVNAAHAIAERHAGTNDKGHIVIRTERDEDHVVVSIEDSGGGIPAEVADHIYDPFFTTKEVGKGTGQGLAIVRSVVCEKHGGDIRFETKLGHGTTFFVRIPIDASGLQAKHTAAPDQTTVC